MTALRHPRHHRHTPPRRRILVYTQGAVGRPPVVGRGGLGHGQERKNREKILVEELGQA